MATNSTDPLDGVEPDAVSAGDVDAAEVRAALASLNPLVRQRGVCPQQLFGLPGSVPMRVCSLRASPHSGAAASRRRHSEIQNRLPDENYNTVFVTECVLPANFREKCPERRRV
ncbi:uncharacterized protein HHUB_4030 (plasmid) [Halobacterium hubeiense]|uniref:Uncharacterized protein n=1 Tax=Halobacterium hubeiense TaxID=1407499 RepID=A0A0U5H782_9EURY|nr:hypothetical protein [Halobacterium hubeiense]CQH63286.1 uncharacterized protein HHUB_4030 [Halobacterium hubeiense]